MTLLYSYYIRTVFVLHSYCICTVFVLYSYCICVAFVLHSYLFVMHSYCICAVFVLYWYCICIVFVLHSYCIRSAFVLHSYCIRIVSYCIRTVLYSYCIRIVSYCIRTAFVLYSYCICTHTASLHAHDISRVGLERPGDISEKKMFDETVTYKLDGSGFSREKSPLCVNFWTFPLLLSVDLFAKRCAISPNVLIYFVTVFVIRPFKVHFDAKSAFRLYF